MADQSDKIDQWDDWVVQYCQCNNAPWRTYCELPTLQKLVGDLSGKSVLNIATRDGSIARHLKVWGADRVLGIDQSRSMIDLARQHEHSNPMGIDYLCTSLVGMNLLESFDLIVVGWQLDMARSVDQLRSMLHAISRHLRHRGRLIAINHSDERSPEYLALLEKYGLHKSAKGPIDDGTPIYWKYHLPDGHAVSGQDFFVSPTTMRGVMEEVGLRQFRRQVPLVSVEGLRLYGKKFWADLLEHPYVVFFDAVKLGGINPEAC